jgi:hypothetical protein
VLFALEQEGAHNSCATKLPAWNRTESDNSIIHTERVVAWGRQDSHRATEAQSYFPDSVPLCLCGYPPPCNYANLYTPGTAIGTLAIFCP